MTTASFTSYFNILEAALWFAISAVLFCKWRRLSRPKRFGLDLPIAFFCFGISDLIEAKTLAWWEPWWLLVLKTLCVLVFLRYAIGYARLNRKQK